jgi:hypothetical protein
MLSFASILVEDFMKESSKEDVQIHQRIEDDIFPLVKNIIIWSLQTTNDSMKLSAIECLNTWFQYISYVQACTVIRYRDLNDIWTYLLLVLQTSDDELFFSCMELITEIFENNPLVMNHELRTRFDMLISSEWSTQKINRFMSDEEFETLQNFASMIISFLEIDMLRLVSKLFSNSEQARLRFLLNLTDFPLLPVVEENVSKGFIEFWSQILDIFTDDLESLEAATKGDQNLWNEIQNNSKALFQELSMIYFKKVQYQVRSHNEYNHNVKEFNSFRMDVGDLFDLLYSQLGPSLYIGLSSTIVTSTDINEIEASFFLLTTLSSNFSDESVNDELVATVQKLFEIKFLSKLNVILTGQTGSDLYARFSIKFLGEINFFYKKSDSAYLNSVIDYLFTCLKSYPTLRLIISKTIMDICDSCRTQLVSSISSFEPILAEVIANATIDTYTREKVVHSVSCIIQSMPDPGAQENYTYNILDIIEKTSQPYLEKAANQQLDERELQYVISLLTCIQEIAKGLQLPDYFEEENEELYNEFKEFWVLNNARIQSKLHHMIRLFALDIEPLSKNSEIAERAILIYKIGLLENFGPFAFSYTDVLEFAVSKLGNCDLGKTLPYIFELLITLLNCRLSNKDRQTLSDGQVTGIINTFVESNLTMIRGDPDLVQLVVSMFTSIVSGRPSYLIQMPDAFRFIVKMALDLLSSREKFVIKAVSRFWVGFLSPKKITQEQDLTWRLMVEQEIGEILTYHTFSGLFDTTRTSVDIYSAIIIILVSKYQLRFKDWATQSLERLDRERKALGKRGLDNREVLLRKVLLTRGSTKKCQELLKTFWKEINGLDWMQSV